MITFLFVLRSRTKPDASGTVKIAHFTSDIRTHSLIMLSDFKHRMLEPQPFVLETSTWSQIKPMSLQYKIYTGGFSLVRLHSNDIICVIQKCVYYVIQYILGPR